MIKLIKDPVILKDNSTFIDFAASGYTKTDIEKLKEGTISYKILKTHNTASSMDKLKLKFDSMASHDITYVGIIQTARASGLKEFPLPYVLTNCHNSLCAVGGTINEDDHLFGLSAAKKYGGDFVPAHQAVIHQYMREMKSGCAKMILGSDSHTRYGALGTMGVGEGGPELVKQLLGRTYDINYPEVVLVYLTGTPKKGTGPQDVALALIGEVFKSGFVRNKVLEFVGPGVSGLSVDFRNGIDVMTTEAACLTSIWQTDDKVREYYVTHKRTDEYTELKPAKDAYYDSCVHIDLAEIKPMIALPFHPSNAYTIDEFLENAADIIKGIEDEARDTFGKNISFDLISKLKGKDFYVDQAVIGGCSGGTYENIELAAKILKGRSTGSEGFWLSVYPASQPIQIRLNKTGAASVLMEAGVSMRTAFCGPCFGAGDVPANNSLSIRHNTRNFPNREGSKPSDGQIASVALMDSRSIAATAINGGRLTGADTIDFDEHVPAYIFEDSVYEKRVYMGYGRAKHEETLIFGPNIKDWPDMEALSQNIVLKLAAVIKDSVTTTDELIPSGETSAYRSNPLGLAEFALSRKEPEYVKRAKAIQAGREDILKEIGISVDSDVSVGSAIYANRPGDGSAREQAASVQKVLGGFANICIEYATKRYRSNLINWGILPLRIDEGDKDLFYVGDVIYIKGIRQAVGSKDTKIPAELFRDGKKLTDFMVLIDPMTEDEKQIVQDGCLINFYRNGR